MTRNAPRPSREDHVEFCLYVVFPCLLAFGVMAGALVMSERAAWWR